MRSIATKFLYWIGIKKRHIGFRHWKGLALVCNYGEFEWKEFYVELNDPITDPYWLQSEYRIKCPFVHPDVGVVSDVMIPRKDFWTMTFTVTD